MMTWYRLLGRNDQLTLPSRGFFTLRTGPYRCHALVWVSLLLSGAYLSAQESHDHSANNQPKIAPPRVFLDKSPRIVWYQLNRLSNERLLLVERSTEDPMYIPVYTAILIRDGMSRQDRGEALEGLIELNRSNAVSELLAALDSIDGDDRQQRRVIRQLANMLLRQPVQRLKQTAESLEQTTSSDKRLLRPIGYAGLVVAGEGAVARELSQAGGDATLDFLAAVALVPRPALRATMRDSVVEILASANAAATRRAALEAIAFLPADDSRHFQLVAPYVADEALRVPAIRTLLKIPADRRDPETARQVADLLVSQAEATPVEQRTSDEFIDAMQLCDQLLALVPVDAARAYRDRLREITVRVVRIHTVEEEMRYDVRYFAVEAGRPVQVILRNEDLMPHNLVVTVPGALREVAELGATLKPDEGLDGKQYVPDIEQVLFATSLVPAGRQERLTFTAPTEPGEYPYVCTFPRHWMRMHGVMVVVDDLDAWLKNPQEPADPIGSNRSFVNSWTLDEISADLETKLRGRNAEIGERLFVEATCAQCHKIRGQGGAVGPELTDVLQRWKGDHLGVLREIVDPSHRVEPKFAVHVIVTLDGQVLSGVVTAQDNNSISIVTNPESPTPQSVARDDIEEITKTATSLMPKGLMDKFTEDEIFEILAYLEMAGKMPASGAHDHKH